MDARQRFAKCRIICPEVESAMESGLELNDRFLFVESLRFACSHLGIDFQFITNNRNLDEFVHYFLNGECKYPTQLLVSEGSLNKCAQEFSSALETELTNNSIPVSNTVASAFNLVKTSTDSTKIDVSAVELAALNKSLKEQQLQEIVISTDNVEADVASKQKELLTFQLECEEAGQELQEAEHDLVQANKEVDDSQHTHMLHNQSVQSMEMQLSGLSQQHTALLVASNTNSVETARARAAAVTGIETHIAPLHERITANRTLLVTSSTDLATARSARTNAQTRVTAAIRKKNNKIRELRTLDGQMKILKSNNSRAS